MVAAALLGVGISKAPKAQAANLTWNQTAATSYNWTDSANWGGAGFPNAIGDVANLSGALAGAQTVNLNAIITIGELNFGASAPSSLAGYTLAGGTNGLLILDDSDGAVSINKLNGSPSLDVISADIIFNDALTISNNSGGGTLTLGTMRSVASDVTLNGTSIAGGAAILTGAIATAGGLIKDGTGIAQMNANTTYAGTTWVKAGRLIANTTASIPVRSAITIDAGAVLETKAATQTWGSIAGAGNVTNTGSARVVTIGRDDTSTSFSGTITADTPANMAITKIGAGTLTLSPSVASTYTGNTIINGGTVSLSFVNTALTSLLAATPLQIAGGNFTMTGKAGLAANQLMGALTVGSTGGTITLVAGDASGTTLRTGAVTATANGATLLIVDSSANTSFRMGTAYTALVLNNRLVFSDGTANSFNWATNTAANTDTTAFSGYTALPISGGGLATTAYRLIASQTQNTAAATIRSLKLSSTGSGTQILDLATFNMTLGAGTTATPGAILIDGTDGWNITGTTGVLRSAHPSAAGDVIFHQYSSGEVTVNADIANNGAATAAVTNLIKAGNGTLILAGPKTFTGAVFVNGGKLQFSDNNQLGASTAVTAVTIRDGATLSYTGTNASISANGAASHTFALQGGNANIEVTAGAATLTLSGIISGAGGMTKLGAGTLSLATVDGADAAANSTYTGPTIVSAGTLSIAGSDRLPDLSPVTVNASATLSITAGNDTIGSLAGAGVVAGGASADRTLTVGGDNTSTLFTGTFTGARANVFVKAGTGTMTIQLGGATAWTGNSSVTAGTLRLNNNNGLPSTGIWTMGNSAQPALLDFNGNNATVGGLGFYGTASAITSQGTVTLGGAVVTITGNATTNNNNNPRAASIIGGTLNMTAARTFDVRDSTNVADTDAELLITSDWSGALGGILKAGGGNLKITGTNGMTGATANTFNSGTTWLDYTVNNTKKINNAGALALGGGTVVLTGNAGAATAQTVAGLTLSTGSSQLTLNAGNGRTLSLDVGAITRTAGQGVLQVNLPTGTQSGTNGLLTSATNDANGIIGGYVLAYDGARTGFASNSAGNIVLATPTTQNTVTSWASGQNISDTGSGFAGALGLADTNIHSLTFNAAGPSTVTISPGGVLNLSSGGILQTSAVTVGDSTITGGMLGSTLATPELIFIAQSPGKNLVVESVITGTTTIVTKAGSGLLRLSGNNNFAGATNLLSGTLQVVGGRAIGDSSTVALSPNQNNVLELLSDETVANISGGQNQVGLASEVRLNENTLTLSAGTGTYSGAISGSGTLIKSGSGTWTIASATTSGVSGNQFTGSIRVDQGQIDLTQNVQQLTSLTAIFLNGPTSVFRNVQDQGSGVNRVTDTATVTLSNTAGGLGFVLARTNGSSNATETVGQLVLNAGHNTIVSTSTSSTGRLGTLTFSNATPLVRNNLATALVMGRTLGAGTGSRGRITFSADPGGSVGGGGAAASQTISILPYFVGEATAGDPTATNVGNSFVTFVSTGEGLRPLAVATEYTPGSAAITGNLTANVRFTATAVITSTPASINSLVLDSATAIALSGSASSMEITAGAILATGAGAHVISGVSGITTGGSRPYYVYTTTAAGSLTLTTPLTTAQPLVKSGAGTLILGSASNAFTDIHFNQGSVQADALDKLGAGALNFFGGTLRFAAAFDPSASGKVVTFGTGGGTFNTNAFNVVVANSIGNAGVGGFTKAGNGNLTLRASASYGGGTLVSGGRLVAGGGADNRLPVGTLLSLTGTGALQLGDADGKADQTVAELSSATGTMAIVGGNGAASILTVNQATSTTFGGVLGGAGANEKNIALVKSGVGTLVLTGASTHTGGTTVNAGTLAHGADNILDNTGAVTVAGGSFNLSTFNDTIGTFVLSGGALNGSTGVLTSTADFDLRSGTVNFSSTGGLGGTVKAVKSTGGTVTLANNGLGSFANVVDVNGGTLSFSAANQLGSAAASNTIGLNNGTLSYSGTGSVALGGTRVVTLGASGGTFEVAQSTGTLTATGGIAGASAGNLTKTGAGTLVIPGTSSWNGGLSTVSVNDGTLRAGFGTAGIAAVSVGATGNLSLVNGAAEVLTLGVGANALTLVGGSRLGFELGAPSSGDQIIVGTGGNALTSGGVITLDFFNLGALGNGTYNLLSDPNGVGGLLSAGTSYALGTAPSGFNYTLNQSANLISLMVQSFNPIYWRGGQDGSWGTLGSAVANWTTDLAGTTDAANKPGATDTVIFSASAAPFTGGSAITTTLDENFTIEGLQFKSGSPSGITAVSINQGGSGTLTVAPTSTSGGIVVEANAGVVVIAAPLVTSGANVSSQTWAVDGSGANGSSLTVSGATTINALINKTGLGVLTLSGSNSGAGGITLTGGTLKIGSTTALGTGTLSVGAGTTIDVSAGAIVNANANAQNWNGSFTFTGSNVLHLGAGAVQLSTSPVLTITAGTLTVGGVIDDGASTFGLTKVGGGTLALDGANTYDGVTTLNQGTLTFGGDNSAAGGGVTMAAGTLLNIAHNVAGTTKALGAGTLTINGGTIDNTSGSAITASGTNNAYVWNSSFAFAGSNNLDLGTGAISLGTAVGTSRTITTTAGLLALGGVISDGTTATQIVKAGAGALALNAANAFTGGVQHSGGTLNLGHAAALGGGTLTFGAAGAVIDNTSGAALTLSTNNAQDWNANFTFAGTHDLNMGTGSVALPNGARTVTVTGGTLTIAGIMDDGVSTAVLTKSGVGTLYLRGVNTFGNNSAVTINGGGTLKIDAESGLGTATNDVTFGTGGGTLHVTDGFVANAGKVFSVQAGPGVIQVDSGTLAIGSAILGTGTATANGGGLIKTGAGTLALTVSSAAYDAQGVSAAGSGATGVGFRVDAGTLQLQGTSNNVVGDLTPNSMTIQLNGGNLSIQTDTASIGRANLWVSADATLTSDRATAGASLTQTIGTGTGAQLTVGNTGEGAAVTLNVAGGANFTSGVATVGFGATTLNRSAIFNITDSSGGGTTLLSLGALTGGANAVTLRGDGDFAQTGIFAGVGASLVLDGDYTGIATLNQTNSFDGGVTIRSGTVVHSANVAGLGTGTLTLGHTAGGANASLTASGTGFTADNAIIVASGSSGTATIGGNNGNSFVYSGPVTLNKDLQINTTGAGSFSLSGALTGAGGLVNASSGAGEVIISSGNLGIGSITQNSATSVMTLSNASIAFTGSLTVSAGTLNITGGATSAPAPAALTVKGGATLNLVNTAGQRLNLGSGAVSLGADSGTTTLNWELGTSSGTLYDSILTTGAATTANNVVFNLTGLAGFGPGNYDLLTASGGLSGATYSIGTLRGSLTGVTLALTPSATLVQLVATASTGDFYWDGSINSSWTGISGLNANWSTDRAGDANAGGTPGVLTSVIFSSDDVTGTALATTLDGAFSIKDLSFINEVGVGPLSSISIASGASGTLTITPSTGTGGINVQTGAPAAITISAPVTLGASQTWAVADAATILASSGGISGTANLTKDGAGILTLSGTNNYVGTTAIAAGVLQAGAANGFNQTSAHTVSAGAILRLNNFDATIGSLAGAGTVENGGANNRTLTVGGNNSSTTFSGALQNGATSTLGLAKLGTGTLTLSGTNTHTGTVTVSAGTLAITGSNAMGTGFFVVGNAAGSRARLQIGAGAAVTADHVDAGSNDTAAGAIYQTGGAAAFTESDGTNNGIMLGGAAGGYGSYSLSGGTVTANRITLAGNAFANATGVYTQTGGTFTNSGWTVVGQTGGGVNALMDISGGTYIAQPSGTAGFGFNHGSTAYSVVNVRGTGILDRLAPGSVSTINLMQGNANSLNNVGILNLSGSATLRTNAGGIISGAGTGSSGNLVLANFNGGTIITNAASSSLINILSTGANTATSGAYIYGGGLTVDTNGLNSTINGALRAPTAEGVSSIAVATEGSGYLSAPMIKISGGSGVGATAIANMVDDGSGNGTFKIGSITITSPGTGYLNADTLTLAFADNASLYTTQATFGAVAFNGGNTSGVLTKAGAGTLTLSGANTYTGGTTVNVGTLALGANNVLADAGNVTIAGGTLNVATFNDTVATVSLQGGAITGSTGVLTSTSAYDLRNGSVSAILGGAVGLNKTTADTVTLSGANTYAGVTSVTGGTLAFSAGNQLGDASATNTLTLNGSTLSYAGSGTANLVANQVVTVGSSGATLNASDAAGILNLQGGIVTSAAANLTKTGLGAIVVTGSTNLNGGNVTVSAGVLNAGFTASGLGAIAVSAGATLNLYDGSTSTMAINGLTLANGSSLGFDLGATGVNDVLSLTGTAAITPSVSLNFNALGTLGAGSYDLLSVSAGTLNAADYVLGLAPSGLNYNFTTVNAGQTLRLTTSLLNLVYWKGDVVGGSWSSNVAGDTNWASDLAGTTDLAALPIATDTLVFASSGATGPTYVTTLDGSFTADSLKFTTNPTGVTAVAVNQGTSGTLTLTPASANNGISVPADAGAITIGAPLATGATQTWEVIGGGTNGSSLNVSGAVAINHLVNKTGAGVLTLSGSNTGSGELALAAGTLVIANNSALGTGTFSIGAGTTVNTGATAIVNAGNNVQNWNGNFTFTGTSTLNLGTGAVTLGDNVTLAAGNNLTVGGAIGDGAATFGFTKSGVGVLTLNGANTYGGLTQVANGALNLNGDNSGAAGGVTMAAGTTLNLGHANSLGSGTLTLNGGFLDNTSGGALTLGGNGAQAWNTGFTFTGTNDLVMGAGAVTLGASIPVTVTAGNLTVNGVIDDGLNTFNLEKAGAGTLTLGAANTYGGATTISAGTLAFSANQTLAAATNTLLFGATAASTTPGNLVLTADATFGGAMIVNTNSAAASQITIGSGRTLTINANVQIGATTPAVASTVTKLTLNGGGAFNVTTAAAGTFTVGGSTSGTLAQDTTLNLTALASTTINVSATGTLRVNPSSSTNIGGAKATLLLPAPVVADTVATATVTAGTIAVGNGGIFNNQAGQINTISLGTGLTTLNANTINVGTGARDIGQIIFGQAGGDLKIRAADGTSRATLISIGAAGGATATTEPTTNNLVDFSSHDADILVTSLNVGNQPRTGDLISEFKFGAGDSSLASVLDVTNVNIGFRTGTATTTSILTNRVNISGGAVTFGDGAGTGTGVKVGSSTYNQGGVASTIGELNISGGTLLINNSTTLAAAVQLGENASAGGGTVTASMNLTGGTTTLAGHIIRSASSLRTTSTVTLNGAGAILDMGGKNIGSASALITFNAQAGTLRNVGEINGGGVLTKSTTGSLLLDTANSFTGGVTIAANGGTVIAGQNNALGTGTVTLAGNNAQLTLVDGITVANAMVLTSTGGLQPRTVSLQTGATSATYAGSISNSSSSTDAPSLTFSAEASGTLIISGIISGLSGRGVSKTGAGTVVLSGANTFTGVTLVSAGTLSASAGSLAATSGITVNGATLTAADYNLSATLALNASGTATLSGTGLNISGAVTNANTTANALNFTGTSAKIILASLAGDGATRFGSDADITGGVSVGTVTVVGTLGAGISGGTVNAGSLNGAITGGTVTVTNLLTGAVSSGTVSAGALTGNVSGGSVTVTNLLTGNVTAGTVSAGSMTGDVSSSVTVSGLLTGAITAGTNALGSLSSSSVTGGTNTISGAATITTVDGGTTSIGGVATITTLTSGTVTLTGATAAIGALNGGTVALGTTALTVSSGTFAGVISGVTGSLTKSDSGTLTLSGDNTFTGGTTISAGTVRAGHADAFGAGFLTLDGGTLTSDGATARAFANEVTFGGAVTFGAATTFTGALTFDGTVGLGAVTRTLTVNSDVTFAGIVSAGGLNKAGAGVLTLSGDNTFSDGMTLSAGTVRVGHADAFGAGFLTLDGGTLTSDGATARTFANEVTFGGNITLGAATTHTGALTFDGTIGLGTVTRTLTVNSDVTFAGIVSAGGLIKEGAGALTLSGDNTFSAGTTLSAGTVRAGHADAFGGGALILNAGRLTSDGATARAFANNVTIGGDLALGAATTFTGALTFGGAVDLGAAARTLTVDSAVTFAGGVTSTDQNLTVGGAGDVTISTLSLNLGLGSLTMNGTGTLLLSVANTFAGATINNGTIKIGHNGSLGSGTVNVGASGRLDLNNQTISNTIVLANGAVLTGGTFAASSLPATTGTLDVVLEGAGVTLAKADTGRLELTGENTYTGATSVTGGGTIAIADFGNGTAASPLGITSLSDPTKLVLSSGSTLEFNGGTSAVTTRSFTIGGSAGIAATGAGTLEFTSASQLATTGEAPALTLTANNAGTNRFAASLVDGNTGLANLAINGTGIWVIGTGANRFKNDIRIEAAAGATIGLENASLPSGATLAVANNATIRWEAGNTTGVKLEIVAGTAAKLDLGSNNVVFSTAPVVASGSGTTANFEKQGGGTLTIAASVNASAFNFTLPANSGMLSVGTGGSIGNVSLATGSKLGGSGTVGAVTTVSGAIIGPGNSPGTLTSSSVSLVGDTDYEWQVQNANGAAGTGYDTLAVTGALNVSGASSGNRINLKIISLDGNGDGTALGNPLNFGPPAGASSIRTFTFATVGSLTLGANTNISDVFQFDLSQFTYTGGATSNAGLWSIDWNQTSGAITLTAVPEPSTYGFGLGALALAAAAIRRRRKNQPKA